MDGVWDGTLIPCIISAGVRTQRVKALNYEYVDNRIFCVKIGSVQTKLYGLGC